MILFRADGNEMVGSGHIMRCLSIAQAARDLGEDCCFVMADKSFLTVIENTGFERYFLNTDFNDMQGELEKFIPIIEKLTPQYIVVDSYYVTEEYLQKLRQYSLVIYMDDLESFAYPVDVLVNYNIYAEKIDYIQMYQEQSRTAPKLFLGPEYVPLRKEFKEIKRKRQPKKVKNILISTGGSDYEHVALKLEQYIFGHEIKSSYKYHFLLGAMNPDSVEITRAAEKFLDLIEVHQNVKQVEELMLGCDIAISAAGSTLYELCACGIPTITYVLADNQILGAQAFSEKGLMIYAGDCRREKDFAGHIMQEVETLAGDFILREQMAEQMNSFVSSNGATNIVKELITINEQI